MSRGAWAATLVLLGVIAWLAWGMRPTDANRIARRLERIAADASAAPRESAVDRLARAARLATALTTDARLEFGEGAPAVEGREAIVALASRAVPGEGPARLSFVDVGITVGEGRLAARATMTAKLVTRDAQSGGDLVDAREVETDWVKQDGEWRITRATLVGTLRR
jgi:hypothetical protein